MPMCAYGKSKKTNVHPAVGEITVKTVEVILSSQGTTKTRRNLDQNTRSATWAGEPMLGSSVKLFWIYA
jgi:hypothetical protein